MRHLIILYIVFWTSQSFGQIKPMIEIEYNHGGYRFGIPGLYHTSEIFKFEIDNNDKYCLKDYSLIEKFLKEDSVSSDEVRKTIKVNQEISTKKIQKLLTELNRNDTILTLNKLHAKAILRKLSFSKIKKITCLNDSDLFPIEDDYSWLDKLIEKKDIKRQIKSKSNFKEYIDLKFNSLKYEISEGISTITVDYYDNLRIKVIGSRDTIIYSAQLNNFMGQPFENLTKSKACNYCTNWDNNVINIQINKEICKLLPSDSKLRKALQIDYYLREYLLKHIK